MNTPALHPKHIQDLVVASVLPDGRRASRINHRINLGGRLLEKGATCRMTNGHRCCATPSCECTAFSFEADSIAWRLRHLLVHRFGAVLSGKVAPIHYLT
jgi:hypothetical protein